MKDTLHDALRRDLLVYQVGQRVALRQHRSYKRSSVHRYHRGKVGVIQAYRGSWFVVRISGSHGVGHKKLIIRPGELIGVQ